jgi:prepilin-type N-terminal cleavage/methylation domain-containing protein
MARGSRGSAGFTLPEALVVIAIVGIFVLFGGPAFHDAYRAYAVRSAANNLVTDVRAMRYNAVTSRSSRTMTINNQANVGAPNQYSFINKLGQTVTFRLENVNIETTSDASITFNINGSTGTTSNRTVIVSGYVNSSRNDRYTITITPSGTVQSAYSIF